MNILLYSIFGICAVAFLSSIIGKKGAGLTLVAALVIIWIISEVF